MVILAKLLLLPVVFMTAYLQFGLSAAALVLILILAALEVDRRYRKKSGFKYRDVIKIVVLGLAVMTILQGAPIYLQLVPTVVLIAAAMALLFAPLLGFSATP